MGTASPSQPPPRVSRGPAEPVADELRILILAPTGNDAHLTTKVLGKAGIAVCVCPDVPDLCRRLVGPCAAILLAEEILRTDSVNQLVAALAQQAAWSDLPVIIITSGGEADQDRLRRLAAFGPGSNVTLLERPFRPGTLTSAVAVALRSRQRQYQVRDLLQSVRASEERYHHILASISDAFISINRDWKITYVNDSYLRLVAPLALSANDLLGNDLWQAFPDLAATDRGRRFRHAMATQRPDSVEVFSNPLNAWLEVRIYPSPETLTLYLRDITSRKRQEEELAALAKRIRDQARTFDATLSHITDFAYTFDLQGRFTYVNKPLLDLWGLPLEQAVGKDFFQLNYPPELAQKLQDQIQQVVRTGESLRDETPYTNPAGEPGFYEYIFNPIFNAAGTVEAVAGSTRDITERKRIEEQLRKSEAAAEQASHAKDDFLAALSHELRTPLNPVLLLATDAAANEALAPELREDFNMIAKNVLLEAHLIDDLLDLTRITRGKLVLDRRPESVRAILQDAINNVQPELLDKQIEFTVSFGPEFPLVFADPVRLQQVFWNVLKNAVKFTPSRGRIGLTMELTAPEGPVVVSVTDSGAGMKPEELGRIFDAFAQGDHASPGSPHRFGGLGLGLAISRSLVELHAGTIRASSPGIGLGSTFTVELPIVATAQDRDLSPNSAQLATRHTHSPVPGMRILLVEDHNPTRAVLTQLLEARNYAVVGASSVGEARKFGTTQPFDLLITDIGLPDGDGYALMAELNNHNQLRGIALTGYGAEQDLLRAQKAGFAAHLTKPISVRTLDSALEAVTAADASRRPEKT